MGNTQIYENELLRRVAEGDEKAFESLFHQYWDHIYSVAMAITKSVVLSEDLVQDIFLKVWVNREKLGEVEQFDDYLFIIARNSIYTALRRKGIGEGLLQKLGSGNEARTPEEELLAKESRQLIHDAVRQLSPQQREVYRLSREAGLKYDEIALQLGISKSTVRNHMVRALQSIREYLQTNTDGSLLILCLLMAVL